MNEGIEGCRNGLKKTERKKCLKERRKGEENEKDEEMDICFFFLNPGVRLKSGAGRPASTRTAANGEVRPRRHARLTSESGEQQTFPSSLHARAAVRVV